MLGKMGWLLLAIMASTRVTGQNEPAFWIQALLEVFPELAVDEELQQTIRERMAYPIPINTCSKADLEQIPGLDPNLIAAMLHHRKSSGAFQSLYELQVLPGMTPVVFSYLRQVLSVKTSLVSSSSKDLKGEYLLFIQPQFLDKAAWTDLNYVGPPIRQWHRLKFNYGKRLSLGFSLENDAGERLQWNKKQKGFDFGTLFIDYKNVERGWHFIAGDYRVNSGQGLVHGSAGSFGSAAWVGRVFRQDGSRGYRSADENLFFRGLYMEKTFQAWRLRTFVSRLKSDGRVEGDWVSETGTGLHRNENELALRKQFVRLSFGNSLRYSMKKGELSGQNLLLHENGRWLNYSSIYHQFSLSRCMIFGEWAYGHNGFSGIQSLVFVPSPKLEWSILGRWYPRSSGQPFSSGFSAFSTAENERGVYLSLEHKTSSHQTWRMYSDWAYRPFPSYLVSTPYWNKTHFIQTEKKLSGVLLTLRVQHEEGKRDLNKEELLWKSTEIWTNNKARIEFEWKAGEAWLMKSRVEYSFFEQEQKQKGVLAFQELQWRPPLKPYYLIFRYTHFTISDYAARIYAYESDVLYAFSVPMFSGKGQRAYVVARYGFSKRWVVWFKVAYTKYEDTALGEKWEGKVLFKWGF